MPCIEPRVSRVRFARAGLVSLSLLAGCSTTQPPLASTAPANAATPPPASTSTSRSTPTPAPTPTPTLPSTGLAAAPKLPPPGPVRSWAELRRQAALRMVAANPDGTYLGEVPNTLLAIPVLEIELHADGSIRKIDVLRKPREALDTLQLATDAVRRAAPFGDVSRLPKPWHFTETFLFNDARQFKPRTLD